MRRLTKTLYDNFKVHVGQNFYHVRPDKILHDKDFDQHLIRSYD